MILSASLDIEWFMHRRRQAVVGVGIMSGAEGKERKEKAQSEAKENYNDKLMKTRKLWKWSSKTRKRKEKQVKVKYQCKITVSTVKTQAHDCATTTTATTTASDVQNCVKFCLSKDKSMRPHYQYGNKVITNLFTSL